MKRFTKDTLISFVIPTGGQRGQSLKSLIDVIARFDEFKVEIIPVGNTSGLSDSQICKPVEVPELARDGEICKMRNLGGSASKGEILVFLDDDAEMPLQWQTLIKHLFEKILSEQIDIGSCRITGPNGRRWYDWNWASRKDIDCPSMLLPYSQTDENLYISGCCMIMRRNVWEQIRFDENRLNHQHDDVSFCHKAHEHGYKFGNETRAIIKHLLLPSGRNPDDPASGAGNFPEMIYLYRSGNLSCPKSFL